MNTVRSEGARASLTDCARPGADPAAAERALSGLLASCPELAGTPGLTGTPGHEQRARHLVWLARRYGEAPFTPLREARRELGVSRPEFASLVETFRGIPELREAALRAPAGKYWSNTILPLEGAGAFDAVLRQQPAYPQLVGLYPGPTCMFRCHFCVRVTGERYPASALAQGNEMLASLVDELPAANPGLMYFSGGLEPLTNPGLGALAARAARRGFRVTLYTNAFALTEQTLARQPGLWDLHAVRTSLYGLSDEEYEKTTGKRQAFQRVRANLARFLELRAEQRRPVRLGLNYLILPGRGGRLRELARFMAELSEAAPGRPLDFLNLRQDYSGREDGRLSPADRTELCDMLHEFEETVAASLPSLDVDYGYALNSLRSGNDASLLRITPEQMRSRAFPQVSAQVDLLGDVYLYREAGFPGLPGARRYIAGRVTGDRGLYDVLEGFIGEGRHVAARPGDEYFLDGFDQAVTARLNQLEDDLADGWGDARGFLR